MVILVTLNLLIYREIKKRIKWLEKTSSRNPKTDYRRRELKIAFLLVTVVIVFLICHALRFFLSLMELLEVVLIQMMSSLCDDYAYMEKILCSTKQE